MHTQTSVKKAGDYKTPRPAEQHRLQAQLTDAAAQMQKLVMGQKVCLGALITSARSCTQLALRVAIQVLSCVVLPVPAKGHYSSVTPAGITSSCEIAAPCSLARELPVCLKVLEQHYIDYCLIFAGLQNVQGDTGKFRDF